MLLHRRIAFLLPLIPDFLAHHPEITIDVTLTDVVVDFLEERADVAIRVGPLRESRLIARKLGESRMVVVASPDYLARHGEPRTPADLVRYNRLGLGWSWRRAARRFPCGARHQGWAAGAFVGNNNPGDIEAVNAVFLGQGGHLPARVRAFLDYLGSNIRLGRGVSPR